MSAKAVVLVTALTLLACLQATVDAGWGTGTRTPDANDTPATATPISSGIPVGDSVNITDDKYDFYKVAGVLAGQTIKAAVNFTQPTAQLNLSIRDPSGNNLTAVWEGGLARGDTALAPVNGTYFIEVSARAGASDYLLSVTVAYPPTIDPGSRVSGNLSANGTARTDFYRISLDANVLGRREVAIINITQSDQGALMGAAIQDILFSNGSHIYNESWNLSRKGSLGAAASYTGWYFCQVHAVGGASGYILDYNRTQSSSDGDNNPAFATASPINGFFEGRVSRAQDHYDWYSYRVGASDNLHIEVKRANSTDGYKVRVHDSNFTPVEILDNWNGTGTFENIAIDLVPILSDMTYFVGVEAGTAFRAVPINQWTDDDSSMDYNISFTSPNHPPQIIAGFENLSVKEDTKARLVMAAHFRDPDGDRLNYTLSGAAHIYGTYICASGELELAPAANWNGKETAYITADDGRGLRTQAVLFATVEPVEDPPFVKKGIADIQMLQGGNDTSLDLSTVFADNDTLYGDRLAYSARENGSITVAINSSSKVRLDCMPDFFGNVAIRFVATDNASNEASSTCNVTVLHVNRPPFVKKAPPGVRLLEDQGVVVDLSRVFEDPDGDPITLAASGNVFVGVATSGTNVTLQPLADASGFTEYIKFTATDDSGEGDAFVIINVTVVPVNDPPRIQTFNPPGDMMMQENRSQEFCITASDVESGAAVNITWYLDGAQTLVGVSSYIFRSNYTSAGAHNLTVEVSDGKLVTAMVWNITVQGQNREPQDVRISSPRQGEIFKEGAVVTFEGTAVDPDGDELAMTWYEGSTELGNGSRFSKLLPSGPHSITLEASDGDMAVRTRPLAFLVKSNSPPTMLSLEPATGRTFQKGETIRFGAEFADADGDVLSYCWTEAGRPLSTKASFNISGQSPGRHQIRLAVFDGTVVVTTNVTIEVAQPAGIPGPGLLAGAVAGSLALVALVVVLAIRMRRPPKPAPVQAPPA